MRRLPDIQTKNQGRAAVGLPFGTACAHDRQRRWRRRIGAGDRCKGRVRRRRDIPSRVFGCPWRIGATRDLHKESRGPCMAGWLPEPINRQPSNHKQPKRRPKKTDAQCDWPIHFQPSFARISPRQSVFKEAVYLRFRTIASVNVITRFIAATSCARTMSAPRSMQRATAAAVPSTRSVGGRLRV